MFQNCGKKEQFCFLNNYLSKIRIELPDRITITGQLEVLHADPPPSCAGQQYSEVLRKLSSFIVMARGFFPPPQARQLIAQLLPKLDSPSPLTRDIALIEFSLFFSTVAIGRSRAAD